ncbi:DUF397 domain-containing protein [Streptomyces sp. NPDC049970]|uniref:DUF397 domain-containing protein n=1 Tax=Streptomyces sp. NPDC049970 TaxID=3155033 RepID=UPI00343252F7
MTIQHAELTVPESAWSKSSYSSGEGGQCVEVAASGGAVHIRDSKDLSQPIVSVLPGTWAGFIGLAAERTT